MFRTYEQQAVAQINDVLTELGFAPRSFEMRAIPFSGQWGTASSVAYAIANELVAAEPAIEEEGLSKKERKQRQQLIVRERAQELAEKITERLLQRGDYARIEAANGYINLYYDTQRVANEVVQTVREQGAAFGAGAKKTDKVMIEYSQPNTHKEFHVGHLRNVSLGEAVSRISEFAGFETVRANYIGDIGMHVIRCLWCFQEFHAAEKEHVAPDDRGGWLGNIYAEAVARLEYRDHVVGLLNELAKVDSLFSGVVDRMMKALYKAGAPGEDVAYILGQIAL